MNRVESYSVEQSCYLAGLASYLECLTRMTDSRGRFLRLPEKDADRIREDLRELIEGARKEEERVGAAHRKTVTLRRVRATLRPLKVKKKAA